MTLERAESDRYVMYYTKLKYYYTTNHICDSALATVFQSSSEKYGRGGVDKTVMLV